MKWDHCGIRAGDLERSLRFYTDVLGLELLEVVTVLDQPFYFVGNDTVRIEIEQANPAQIAAATGPQAGLYHLAFEVDDLEGAADRLRDAGAQFLLPPSQFPRGPEDRLHPGSGRGLHPAHPVPESHLLRRARSPFEDARDHLPRDSPVCGRVPFIPGRLMYHASPVRE